MAQGSQTQLIEKLLDSMQNDIVPLTLKGVKAGNKLFGAAIYDKNGNLILAETNNETACPLYHGEVHCIFKFFENKQHPPPAETVFFATHEPCSLCLSAITWSGFSNFYYLFTYEDSKDAFAIPYDIDILLSVYHVPDPDRKAPAPGRDMYNRENKFWKSYGIKKLIQAMPDGPEKSRLEEKVKVLSNKYDELSAIYQSGKGNADIPFS